MAVFPSNIPLPSIWLILYCLVPWSTLPSQDLLANVNVNVFNPLYILTPRIGYSGPPPPPPPPRVKSMSQETEILLLQLKSMSNTTANTLSNGKHGIQRLTHYPKTNTQSNQVTQPERSKGAKDEVKRPKGPPAKVGARRAPRLLVSYIYTTQFAVFS